MVHQLRPSHLNRYRQITAALSRNGLGYFAAITGTENFLLRFARLWGRRHPKHVHSTPEAVRRVLEDLGTTFVKLGQILSTRSDLISPEMQAELQKLQDNVNPLPLDVVEGILIEECGRTPDEVFSEFHAEPIGSASIGQAHTAILKDGTEVVVKVRRPGVENQIHIDLEILESMARNAQRLGLVEAAYDLEGMVQEFGNLLSQELDYRQERRNAERLAKNFADEPMLIIPKIYPEYTTERAIVLERMRGINIRDTEALDAAGIDRKELASRAVGYVFKMIFEDGFFHADLHPGNMFVQDDGSIALIDFGQVGELDENTRDQLIDLVMAAMSGDSDRLTDAILILVRRRGAIDREGLRREMSTLMSRYRSLPLSDLPLDKIMDDVLAIARVHQLRIPTDLVSLIKTLIMIEGIGETLDPGFNLGDALKPHGRKLLLMRFSPGRQMKRLTQAGMDALSLSAELPRRFRRILDDVEQGEFTILMKPSEFDPIIDRLERIANRVIAGILVASLIGGLAILTASFKPTFVADSINSILIGATVAAGLLSAYLMWKFFRRAV